MSKTVVGLFSSMSEAEQIRQALLTHGYTSQDVHIVANDPDNSTDLMDSNETDTGGAEGVGQKISNFFHGLTGGDEEVHQHYATGINNGGALLAITCEDGAATKISATLRQNGARDIETTAPSTKGAGATLGTVSTPIVEGQRLDEKREVDRGGVRVYTQVANRRAAADVNLGDETSMVERRDLNREATAADFNMGQGSTTEPQARDGEGVVGKIARVVEDVLPGRASSEPAPIVPDSVRKV